MNLHQKRIFVGNLPPNVQENEIEENFKIYGDVVKIEIKHKKEDSSVFAFVTLKIDDRTLNKCFQEFRDYDWNGYQVNLQLAKESFLERLKREREENSKAAENKEKVVPVKPHIPETTFPVSSNKKTFISSYHSSSDSEPNDAISKNINNKSNVKVFEPSNQIKKETKKSINLYHSSSELENEVSEIDNKKSFKSNTSTSIKKKAVLDSYHSNTSSESEDDSKSKTKHQEISKEKKSVNEFTKNNERNLKNGISIDKNNVNKNDKISEAERKRKQSLSLMKNAYIQQKSAIKSALSSIDQKKSNKIVFNDDDENENLRTSGNENNSTFHFNNTNQSNRKRKLSLFDEEDKDDNINFQVKKQFEGEQGQKLLQLQSRFTNDRRFTLDSRFVEDNEEEKVDNTLDNDEKQKQLEILESVLGKKITNHKPKESTKTVQKPRAIMTRFDPSKPEHSKYEIKDIENAKESKKKIKEKIKEDEQQPEADKKVEVSKETFYKVKGNLKQSLQENQSFSLLSMFGRAEEEKEDIEQTNEAKEITKSKYMGNDHNPFKYDSSDSEDEPEDNKKLNKPEPASIQQIVKKENFFFVLNDERLQEANDFLKKLGMEVKDEPFDKRRRELKKIVRDKIKNNMRNHRPFRNKIGKNRMIKVKKAKKK